MKRILTLVVALLLVSPTVLAEKPDPNVPNPPLQVKEYNVDGDGYIAVHEQGVVSVKNEEFGELDVNVTGGQIDADVTGSIVEVVNPDFIPLNVDVGPFYGLRIVENRGCSVAFAVGSSTPTTESNECTPGGFQPQVIEQVSVRADLQGSGVTEGFLSLLIRNDDNPITEFEHVVPLKSIYGILVGTQLTRLYVPDGYSLFFKVKIDNPISVGAARIDFSGYRVQAD